MVLRGIFGAARRCALWMMSVAILFAVAAPCLAQEAQDENATLTLHVYTNLIQIPVLILSPYLDYAPKVDPKKLTVTLGDGQPFHPNHIRLEGDDPIALAILFDVSDSKSDLPARFGPALAKLAEQSLRPQDRVAIYALDCGLLRISGYASADADSLKVAGERARDATTPREDKHRRSCGTSLRLLDALAAVTNGLSRQPGRRVLFAVSGGSDNGSKISVEDLHRFANDQGVAIFGLTQGPGTVPRGLNLNSPVSPRPQSFFSLICENTGGLALHTSSDGLSRSMASLVKMVRGRIIVEFPRPGQLTSGPHDINVAIAKSIAFIRPAGSSVPLPDPGIVADPNTIHPEDSVPPAPQ
jgi:hypothetical protein